jgi:hypothetical protein
MRPPRGRRRPADQPRDYRGALSTAAASAGHIFPDGVDDVDALHLISRPETTLPMIMRHRLRDTIVTTVGKD